VLIRDIGKHTLKIIDQLLDKADCATVDRLATLMARYFDVRLADTVADEETAQFLLQHLQVRAARKATRKAQTTTFANTRSTLSTSALRMASSRYISSC
jgi:hypothetical protein